MAVMVHPEVGPDKLGFVSFWAQTPAVRGEIFRQQRGLNAPQWFHLPKVPFTKSGDGAWALVTHEQVVEASRNAKIFNSAPTANSFADLPQIIKPYFNSMINFDDPEHARMRRIVSRAFTPKILSKMEADLQRRAAKIVDDIIANGPKDFVTQVAARLPVEVICDMMGIDPKHHLDVQLWTNQALGYTDQEYNGGIKHVDEELTVWDMVRSFRRFVGAGRGLFKLAKTAGELRRANPTDDLTSKLVAAADGDNLTPQELGSFFGLLVAAGNETTRNSIAHAIHLFTENPDQLALLMEDFDGRIAGAIEEIVRISTPVIQFRRTVAEDIDFHGTHFKKGDKVILFYNSANRDESVFENPDKFDILRSPNPHVGFGGPGPHFCLGAHLARREMTVMLRELYTRLPQLRSVGEPDYLRSYFINGIKHMSYDFERA